MDLITSRAVIGRFMRLLEQGVGANWATSIGMYFKSDQKTEVYPWLGQVPAMRQWIGGRQPKGLVENHLSITNQPYESTLRINKDDLRRDKTGQLVIRISEHVTRAQSHWMSMLSTLIIAAESAVGYDGEYFFDTDHVEGNNVTSQSNDINIDISAIPATAHGSTTAPSPEEISGAILQLVQQMLSFKDNENEPMNENAKSFLVMVPITFWAAAQSALSSMVFVGGATNPLKTAEFSFNLIANPRLTWTNKLAVFRTDGNVKPFILQEEKPITIESLAEGSESSFMNNEYLFGIDASRAVGYGYWQDACLGTLI